MNISNEGTADLVVSQAYIEVNDGPEGIFQVVFEEEIVIEPRQGYELEIIFSPREVREYRGTLHIISNDDEREDVTVALVGVGFIPRHFSFVTTGASHSLLINAAEIDRESLVEEDEIGVFTPDGVCAGAAVIGETGEDLFPVGIAAWGDDPNTGEVDGFRSGEGFAFRLWDASAHQEYEALVEWGNGPRTWQNGGFTTVERLYVFTEATPVLRLSTQSIDFGEVLVDTESSRTLTIYNIGNGVLVISEISIDNDVFMVGFEEELRIDPGSSGEIEVLFRPLEEGEYTGVMTIVSNDPVAQEVEVNLRGVGTIERIPDIALSEESHDFGEVPVGESGEWVLRLSNLGTSELTISAISVVQGEEAFSTNWEEEVVLGINESYDLHVFFTPEEIREYAGELLIESDDPDEGELSVALSGIGVRPGPHFRYRETGASHSLLVNSATLDGESLVENDEIGVFTPNNLCAGAVVIGAGGEEDLFPVGIAAWGDDPNTGEIDGFRSGESFIFLFWDFSSREEIQAFPNYIEGPTRFTTDGFSVLTLRAEHQRQPDISLETGILDFGEVIVGESRTLYREIRNVGTAELTVSQITLADDAGVFSTNFSEEFSLSPGESFLLGITFVPNEEAEFTGQVTVLSNDPDQDEVSFGLRGIGIPQPPPDIEISADAHAFGDVVVGETAFFTLTINNVGYQPLLINDVTVDNEVFSVGFNEEVEILRGESYDLSISFTPSEPEFYEGSLTIFSNDPDEGEISITLTGRGVETGEPDIALSDDRHFFGNVPIYDTAQWELTLLNQGNARLTITNISIVGEGFTVDFTEEFFIRPGERRTVLVSFAPTQRQAYSGALIIESNDPDEEVLRVLLTGVGVAPRPHFSFTQTDVNHSLLINRATLNGELLNEGDEIGVFTPNGLCAGAVMLEVVNGEIFPVGLAAWADDAATGEIDGFRSGEEFAFRIWDLSERQELEAIADYVDGPSTFTPNGFSVLILSSFTEAVPRIRVSPLALDFGLVPVGSQRELSVNISNIGDANLTISDVQVSTPDGEGGFTANFEDELVLEPGQSYELGVTFAPQEEREYRGQLIISSDDPERGAVYVDLLGEGIPSGPPRIVISENRHDFGELAIGLRDQWSFMVTNRGGEVLEVERPQVIGEGFQIDITQPFSLDPGDSRRITVTFEPLRVQEYRGTIVIVSNDPDQRSINVTVTGVGVAGAFHWAFQETDNNMSIMVLAATIDGRSLQIRDQIGVFNQNGLCVGASIIEEGFPVGLAAWGDDASTEEIDGLRTGEAMIFRLWDANAERDLEASSQFIEGENAYQPNGFARIILSAETGGPHFFFVTTDVNHSLLIEEALLDGESLQEGDEIGVFTPNELCAGAVVLISEDGEIFPAGLAAWGDDPTTDEIDGFRNGESFAFRYWDRRAIREYNAVPEYIEGPETWTPNGFTTLRLSGRTGRAPDIFLSAMTIEFGNVVVGAFRTRTLVVSNRGDAELIVEGVEVEGEGFAVEFEERVSLDPGESFNLPVTFTPQEIARYQGTLTLTSNDPDEGEIAVSLLGSGVEDIPPHITVSPQRLDFGEVLVGQQRRLTIAVSNTGNRDLVVSSVEFVGEGFSVDRGEGFTLESGDFIEIGVVFTPRQAIDYTGTVVIRSNDPDRPTLNVSVAGQGITGALHWSFLETDNNMSILIVSATINNRSLGVQDQIGVFTPQGLCAGATVIETDFPIGLAAWGDDPSTEEIDGFRTGERLYYRFWDSEGEQEYEAEPEYVEGEGVYVANAFVRVNLRAFTAGPHFQFTVTDVNHSLLIREALLDNELLGEDDEIAVFTSRGLCAGAVVLELIEGEIYPVGLAAFGDDATTEEIDGFATGEEFAFRYWDHRSRREFNAQADYIEGPSTFTPNGFTILTLTGRTGRAPDIAVSPSLMDFRRVPVESQRTLTLTLFNRGELDLVINSIILEPEVFGIEYPEPPEGITIDDNGNIVISPNASYQVFISFAPTEVGRVEGRATIISNDPDEEEVVVTLVGEGIEIGPPQIVISEREYHFGEVLIGLSSSHTFALWNEGGSDLEIRALEVVQPGDGERAEFVVQDIQGMVLSPGDTAHFQVTFIPLNEGVRRGEVIISSNDPDEGEIRIALTGVGVRGALRWAFRETDNNMSLLIEEATVDGELLQVGDQIGVFTAQGLPAGATEVPADGFPVGLAAWGDDVTTEEIDGFQTGEQIYYRIYLIEEDLELEATPFYEEGEGRYVANGFALLRLTAYRPQVGAHFQFVETDNNHSLLVTEALLDGQPLAVGDEIGVLTPENLVAGGVVIEEAGGEVGFPAWGDDPTTDEIDGFRPGEAFNFRFWDHQVRREFVATPHYIDGPEVYQVNGFTVLTLTGVSGRRPLIVLSENAHDFGDVEIGQVETWSLTIRNRGDGALVISRMVIEGNEAFIGDFGEMPITIMPGGAYSVEISFRPEEEREHSAQMIIESNDPDNEELRVNLSGRGVIILRPDIAVEPLDLDFGEVPLGQRAEEFVTISNEGEGELVISDVVVDNERFSVVFEREAREFYWEFIETDNNMSLLIQEATLRGEILGAGNYVGVFTQTGLCAGYAETTEEYPLGLAAWGDEAGTPNVEGFVDGETIFYRYWDTDAGREYSATPQYIEGDNVYRANGFAVVNLSSQGRPLSPGAINQIVIQPGATYELSVIFSPVQVGEERGILTIQSNDEDEEIVEVNLRGIGVRIPARVEVSEDYHDFGEVLVGEVVSWGLVVRNGGMEELEVGRVYVEGAMFEVVDGGGFVLGEGEERVVEVRYVPEDG
ncbi:MAG: choice-of-anchor D domain-containing protein, partial [bacterium]